MTSSDKMREKSSKNKASSALRRPQDTAQHIPDTRAKWDYINSLTAALVRDRLKRGENPCQ